MINVEENLLINKNYIEQKDLLLKAFYYSTSVIIVIEILRNQISETNLLQLVPGFYLLLLFLSFIILLGAADFLLKIPLQIEKRKSFGTKTNTRQKFLTSFKLSILLFFFLSILSLNSIIPISLDSFNTYGEKTLENIWSFNEVIQLEIVLLLVLITFSQVPTLMLFFLENEKEGKKLPKYWKTLTLSFCIFSGFLTPTIDGYTQLSFSISAFSIYLIIINWLEKRIALKLHGKFSFGS
jgi:hypothetical protein